MAIELSPEIAKALGPIVGALAAEGFVPTQVEEASSFGNFSVLFSCGPISASVVRDRGQFHVGGAERSVLEAASLWRTFSGPRPIVEPLLAWLLAQQRANPLFQPTAFGGG